MKKKIVTLLASLMLVLSVAFASPASAGNGTNNFYLTANCKTSSFIWVRMNVTNYDHYFNQVYHVSWTSSGFAVAPTAMYVNGVKARLAKDAYYIVDLHNRSVLTMYRGSDYCTVVL